MIRRLAWKQIAGWTVALALLASAGYALERGLHHWVSTSPLFIVRQVEVGGNRLLETEEILALAAIPDSIRIFAVAVDSIRARIQENQYVHSATVRRRLPSTLEITVREKRIIAFVAGTRMALLEENGEVLPEPARPALLDLPVISGLIDKDDSVTVAENAGKLAWAIALLRYLEHPDIRLQDRISEINMGAGNTRTLFLVDNAVPVYLPTQGNIRDRLHELAQFLRFRATLGKPQSVEYINLKFADQVVVKYTRGG